MRNSLTQARDSQLRSDGLALPALIAHARPGAVFGVTDSAIDFPTDRLPGAGPRTEHDLRFVIVLQARLLCASRTPKTIQVIPCTTSYRGTVESCDVEIPASEEAFTRAGVVALVSIVQPVLKADLVKHYGQVSPVLLGRLMATAASNFGLHFDVALPPRP